MSRKSDIKTCRYANCQHELKRIDISSDEYVNFGARYFHKDCYEKKQKEDEKAEKLSNDLKSIRTLWLDYIDNTVVCSYLFKEVNKILAQGVDSSYIVFTLYYVIEHKLNLHYPAGLKYFVNKQEIKDAYAKKHYMELARKKFHAVDDSESAPKFTVAQKKNGFQSILKD